MTFMVFYSPSILARWKKSMPHSASRRATAVLSKSSSTLTSRRAVAASKRPSLFQSATSSLSS